MITQSIIVYRNPMEQALWEGLMSGTFFPIIASIVTFFAVLLITDKFTGRYRYSRSKIGQAVGNYGSLAIAAVAGAFTIYKMWI